ncbi:MAG: RNA polymerase sporulation sigma factor SigH [Clostridia bacterium]|nr:RNA polymerase sporulation sigma factor SigH [Clostridia bacterium]
MATTNLWQFSDEKYNSMTDEAIIKLIHEGDKTALDYIMNKYKEIVNIKVGKYFIIGAEKEDIVQEGLIGLYKAIKNFDTEKENSFKTFANLCIERQLITAIKTSNRQKHMPLNSYLSLNKSAYEDDEAESVLDVFETGQIEDPLDTITKKEYYTEIEDAIDKSLSDFEKKVLNRFTKGESYVQIADRLNTPVKSIDNAIQRIRKKAIKNIDQ